MRGCYDCIGPKERERIHFGQLALLPQVEPGRLADNAKWLVRGTADGETLTAVELAGLPLLGFLALFLSFRFRGSLRLVKMV